MFGSSLTEYFVLFVILYLLRGYYFLRFTYEDHCKSETRNSNVLLKVCINTFINSKAFRIKKDFLLSHYFLYFLWQEIMNEQKFKLCIKSLDYYFQIGAGNEAKHKKFY